MRCACETWVDKSVAVAVAVAVVVAVAGLWLLCSSALQPQTVQARSGSERTLFLLQSWVLSTTSSFATRRWVAGASIVAGMSFLTLQELAEASSHYRYCSDLFRAPLA
jgi:hypothetical protein